MISSQYRRITVRAQRAGALWLPCSIGSLQRSPSAHTLPRLQRLRDGGRPRAHPARPRQRACLCRDPGARSNMRAHSATRAPRGRAQASDEPAAEQDPTQLQSTQELTVFVQNLLQQMVPSTSAPPRLPDAMRPSPARPAAASRDVRTACPRTRLPARSKGGSPPCQIRSSPESTRWAAA